MNMFGEGLEISEFVGIFWGFVLTIYIFSYLFGDNGVFRIAIHIFIGVSAGFVAMTAFYSIIWPQVVTPLLAGSGEERFVTAIPLILSLLLLAKISDRFTSLGQPVMAFLVGIGAATAIGGAVTGTLFPQIAASVNVFTLKSNLLIDLVNGGIVLLGTVVTFAYFHFGTRVVQATSRKPPFMKVISQLGQLFIAITLGALFAGVYTAALAALMERLNFLINLILSFIVPGT